MRAVHHTLVVVVAAACVAALVSGCDIFSNRQPCAVDDECDDGEACVEGFCAAAADEVPPPDGVDAHPLRGSACPTPGLPCSDAALTCSIFLTCEESCSDSVPCSDGDVGACVDVGAGPSVCTKDAGDTREVCTAEADPHYDRVDVTDDAGPDCVDGDEIVFATNVCGTSGSSRNPPSLVGGSFTVQLNETDAVVRVAGAPCADLEFLDFNDLTAIGGSVFIGAVAGTDTGAAQPPAAVRFDSVTSVLGDVSYVGATTSPVVRFDELRVVVGSVIVTGDEAATEVEFPSLTDVGGDVTIADLPAATRLDLSSIVRVGGAVHVSNCPHVPRCSLDALAAASTDVTIDGVDDAVTCP